MRELADMRQQWLRESSLAKVRLSMPYLAPYLAPYLGHYLGPI